MNLQNPTVILMLICSVMLFTIFFLFQDRIIPPVRHTIYPGLIPVASGPSGVGRDFLDPEDPLMSSEEGLLPEDDDFLLDASPGTGSSPATMTTATGTRRRPTRMRSAREEDFESFADNLPPASGADHFPPAGSDSASFPPFSASGTHFDSTASGTFPAQPASITFDPKKHILLPFPPFIIPRPEFPVQGNRAASHPLTLPASDSLK